jgi:cytochrome P450
MTDTPHRPPGPPVVDNALRLGDDPLRFLTAVQDAYGGRHPLVRVAPAVGPTVNVVTDATLVHEVLADRDRFGRPNPGPGTRERVGLLSSEGAMWEAQRSTIQPEFVGARLASYADTAGDAVEALLAGWPDDGELDLWRELAALALQVITRTLFGRDVTRERADAIHDAMRTVGRGLETSPLTALLPDRLRPGPSDEFEAAVDEVDAFAEEVVDWHLSHDDPPRTLLTALLESDRDPSRRLTRTELVDQTALFVTGGHETTALTITYAFHWLSQRPDVRERVRAEARRVLDGDRPGWADLADLRVTERVVRETLRLTPAAWNVAREARRPTRLRGATVDAGELLLASPYAHGRDRRAWDDPDAFRPERWAADGGASRSNPSYFPFGSGPRVCVARQLALTEAAFALAHVLQRYDVDVVGDDVDFRPGVTLQPGGPVRARVRTLA